MPVAALNLQAALTRIGIGSDDLHMVTFGVSSDRVALIFGRVFLMLGRHAHIFGRPDFLGLHVSSIFRFVTLLLNQLDIPTCVLSHSPSLAQSCLFEPKWVCDWPVIFSVFSTLRTEKRNVVS